MRVLLAGHPETTAIWQPVAELLDESPLIWSLPGYGRALTPGLEPSKDAYAQWLISEVEQVGEPVHLVGHDWGGLLTVRVASLRPDLLHSWVSDALGHFDPDHQWHPAARAWQTPELGETTAELALQTTDEQAIEGFKEFSVPAEQARLIRGAWDQTMWSCALSLYRSAVNIHQEWGPEIAGAAERPGLALITDEDFTEKKWGHRAAAKAGARVAELPGLGHWWLVQDPKRGAAALQEFWSSIESPSTEERESDA
jgi:pimeloyl-ACP methyl ester carboxylesterase